MRILVLTNLYPNPFEPQRATFNRQQVRALARQHAVQVIAPISWVDELGARWRGRAALPAGRRVECDGVVVDHPRYFYPPKVLRSCYGHFYRASVRRTFQRAVADLRPDVVLAPWAFPDGWAAGELGREMGLPVLIKVHGCDVLWGLKHSPDRKGGTQQALCRADGVVAVSEDLARNVVRFGADPGRVAVVYDGVETQKFCPGAPSAARARLGLPDEPLILCVANLFPVKGLDLLVTACAQLAARQVAFRCCVIGEGPQRSALQRQIDHAGLTGRVELLGTRAHETLPDWYRAASVFALSSHSEGVPCVLLEAMACGTPFVATRVGGIPEVAHLGQGQLVNAGNVPELVSGLEAALRSSRPHDQGLARSHAHAATELADFLGSVVERHARRAARPTVVAV